MRFFLTTKTAILIVVLFFSTRFTQAGVTETRSNNTTTNTTTTTAFTPSSESQLITARGQYEAALAQARLAEADIQLKAAQASLAHAEANKRYAEIEYIKTRVEHLRFVLHMLREEYARVKREEANIQYKLHELRVHQALCSDLADGLTAHGGFQCIHYFRRYLVAFNLQKKFLFEDKVDALPASEFIGNYPEVIPQPFTGGNVGQLIVFAQRLDLSFVPFGKAHISIVSFLDAISDAAQKKLQEYRFYMDGIRAGTLDVFKLPTS